jgi:hypothetical protein
MYIHSIFCPCILYMHRTLLRYPSTHLSLVSSPLIKVFDFW